MARSIPPDRRALPLDQWPDGDQSVWAAAIAEGDILDGRGPAAHWRPATRVTNMVHYGRWLGYWKWRDALDETAAPASRVTPEAVHEYHAHLAEIVAPRTRLSMLVGLKEMIRVMTPNQSWRWLQDLCNRVQQNAPALRDKRALMRPSAEIYGAAISEMERARRDLTLLRDVIAYRDALMLAMFTARPVRRKNMTQIEQGQHLVEIDRHWQLVFRAEETKTSQPIDLFLPDELIPWLVFYLEEVRPRFSNADQSLNLWLGMGGGPLKPHSVYLRIRKLSKRLLGVPIYPHLLRDCAATSLSLVSPDVARAAAALLGHRHFSTTQKNYIQAKNLEASRYVNGVLDDIMVSLESMEDDEE